MLEVMYGIIPNEKTENVSRAPPEKRFNNPYIPARFEGGQTPLYQRLPKLKGLKNKPKGSYLVVNLRDIVDREWDGKVSPESLKQMGLTKRKGLVKILGDGEVSVPLEVKINAISESAKEKIESAGGSVEIID